MGIRVSGQRIRVFFCLSRVTLKFKFNEIRLQHLLKQTTRQNFSVCNRDIQKNQSGKSDCNEDLHIYNCSVSVLFKFKMKFIYSNSHIYTLWSAMTSWLIWSESQLFFLKRRIWFVTSASGRIHPHDNIVVKIVVSNLRKHKDVTDKLSDKILKSWITISWTTTWSISRPGWYCLAIKIVNIWYRDIEY